MLPSNTWRRVTNLVGVGSWQGGGFKLHVASGGVCESAVAYTLCLCLGLGLGFWGCPAPAEAVVLGVKVAPGLPWVWSVSHRIGFGFELAPG